MVADKPKLLLPAMEAAAMAAEVANIVLPDAYFMLRAALAAKKEAMVVVW